MIRMPRTLLESIREHGKDSHTEEACGVMMGYVLPTSKELAALERLSNSRDGERHRRFLITSDDYRRAEAEASARSMELLGFYHSHPNHPAYPSAYDLEHAWPFFSYVIVSVQDGEPQEVRSFVMAEDRMGFAEEEIETF